MPLPIWVFLGRAQPGQPSHPRAAACAAQYAQHYGLPPPGDGVRLLPGGKPVLESGTLGFSVSHSGQLWACAVHTGQVGLDVQLQDLNRPLDAMARRIFTPQELDYYRQHPRDFYRQWCAKEAWIKYLGETLAAGHGRHSMVEGGALLAHKEGAQLLWLDGLPADYCGCLWGQGSVVELKTEPTQ